MEEKDWMHTGETETGLEIWAKQTIIDGEKYLKYRYKDSEGKILVDQCISFNQITLLKGLRDIMVMENGI
jgi:hypothetical protein